MTAAWMFCTVLTASNKKFHYRFATLWMSTTLGNFPTLTLIQKRNRVLNSRSEPYWSLLLKSFFPPFSVTYELKTLELILNWMIFYDAFGKNNSMPYLRCWKQTVFTFQEHIDSHIFSKLPPKHTACNCIYLRFFFLFKQAPSISSWLRHVLHRGGLN